MTDRNEKLMSDVISRSPETPYTVDTLPNGLPVLRTGTASDGRALISARHDIEGSLRDIRARLPRGWSAEIYVSGIDIVLTHVGEVQS